MLTAVVALAAVALPATSARAQQAGTDIPSQVVDSERGSRFEVSEAYPGLLRLAAIPPDSAVHAALAKVNHGRLASAAIENRGRRLVYVIRVDEKHKTRELLVDAETGRVLSNHRLRHGEEDLPQ